MVVCGSLPPVSDLCSELLTDMERRRRRVGQREVRQEREGQWGQGDLGSRGGDMEVGESDRRVKSRLLRRLEDLERCCGRVGQRGREGRQGREGQGGREGQRDGRKGEMFCEMF